jgi:hypothetical protein
MLFWGDMSKNAKTSVLKPIPLERNTFPVFMVSSLKPRLRETNDVGKCSKALLTTYSQG